MFCHQASYLKGSCMKSVIKPLLISTLLAAMGFSALAQTTTHTMGSTGSAMGASGGQGQGHGRGMHHGMRDPAKMEQMWAQRQEMLKTNLQLAASQDAAWASYTAAMKPPVNMPAGPDRAAMEKLTTPERIELMKSMRTQRDAQMDKRMEATKAFYAVLTPSQKKVFDTQPRGHAGGKHGHGGHGARHQG
jgi:protein CpxP